MHIYQMGINPIWYICIFLICKYVIYRVWKCICIYISGWGWYLAYLYMKICISIGFDIYAWYICIFNPHVCIFKYAYISIGYQPDNFTLFFFTLGKCQVGFFCQLNAKFAWNHRGEWVMRSLFFFHFGWGWG